MKLRPEMECKLSEIIWFTKDGLDFLEKVFGNAVPRICPHIGVFERCKEGMRTITPRTITPRTITPGQIPPGQLPP